MGLGDFFRAVKDWVCDRIDDVKDFFSNLGSSSSYSGSVEETIEWE